MVDSIGGDHFGPRTPMAYEEWTFYRYGWVLGPRCHMVNSIGGGQVVPRSLIMAYEERPVLWIQSGPMKNEQTYVQSGPRTTLSYG